MIPSQPPAATSPLLQQLCEICALEHFLIEVFAMQQLEPALQKHDGAIRLVARSLAMVHQHTSQLAALLEIFPGGHETFTTVASARAGRFTGFVGQAPGRDAVAVLCENYPLLQRVAMDYTVLHSMGLVLGDPATAGLALMHLRDVIPLVTEIAQLMPSVVFQQLAAGLPELDPAASEAALANTQHTWTEGGRPEDSGAAALARLFP